MPIQKRLTLRTKGIDRERQTGAFHLGRDGPGLPGAQRRGGDAVGLVVKTIFKAQTFRIVLVLGTLASSALVIEAGQRWFK